MAAHLLLRRDALEVYDYHCSAGPRDRPFVEQYHGFSIAYVRRGSFGCRTRGRHFELIAGSFLSGRPGDDYLCTHAHHDGGDECLSFHFGPGHLDELGLPEECWHSGALPPIAGLGVLGARAQAAAESGRGLALEEAGTLLAAHYLRLACGERFEPPAVTARDRRRAVRAALWLDAHAGEDVGLARVARASGVSAFHFLRVFTRVTGVTPHQYLLRARLRRAAQRLAGDTRTIAEAAFEAGFGDLSNFIRAFRRAAGVSPRQFRLASRADRKIVQERLAAPALV